MSYHVTRSVRPRRLYGSAYLSGCSPYAQPNAQVGAAARSSSTKVYVVDVPIYAQTQEDQADWNALEHTFSILEKDEKRDYVVLQNIANTKNGDFQIYPSTGVKDADGNTFFPANTWAFAISPRNLKQYNYQMLMDSLVWNNYTVESLHIDFIPSGGANQAGLFEAVLIPNAQQIPAIPYTNQTNSIALNFSQRGSFSFSVAPGNMGQPVKDLRGIQEHFDSNSDFGILWTRVSGVPNIAAGKHLEVGKLQIKFEVTLSNYAPNPYAQLIGPWIEAGFPISPEGDEPDPPIVQTRKSAHTTGSMMLDVESAQPNVELRMVERGRVKMPRWYIIPTVEDKTVTNLRAHGNLNAAGHKLTHRASGENGGTMEFPSFITTQFDGGITGKALLDGAGDSEDKLYSVSKPIFPVVDSTGLYDQSVTITTFPATPSADDTRLQLVFFENQKSDNTTNLAQGGVKVSYTPSAEKLGLRAGATLKFLVSFQPGTVPIEESNGFYSAAYQTALGWNTNPSVVTNGARNGFLNTLVTAGVAGLKAVLGKNGKNDSDNVNLDDSNQYSSGTEAHTGSVQVVNEDGSGAQTVGIQSQAFKVPEDATYRAEIGELDDLGRKQIAETYLEALPAACKYGVNAFVPGKLTGNMSRLTITGQLNSLHQAYIALVGASGNAVPTFDVTSKELTVLAASRVNPNEDPELFFETAISVTPLYDGLSASGMSGVMLKNAVPITATDKGFFAVTETKQVGNKIKEFNTTLDSLQQVSFAASNKCNFSIAWPSHLVDPVSKTLTKLEAGEEVFFSIIKSSAVTYSHTEAESVGTFNFVVFPNMALGRDKAAPGNAGCKYTLEMGEGMSFTGVTKGAELTESAYMCIDGERRFALQTTVPFDTEKPVQRKGPKNIKLNRTKF